MQSLPRLLSAALVAFPVPYFFDAIWCIKCSRLMGDDNCTDVPMFNKLPVAVPVVSYKSIVQAM